MFSIFKNYKRRNADLLLLSEAVASLRSEVTRLDDLVNILTLQIEGQGKIVYTLKEKTEDLETELENCVTLRQVRNELDEFMRDDSWDYIDCNVDLAIDDKLGDYYDTDVIDSQLEEYLTKDQAKAELAKLSAMLFVSITRSGLNFDEIEKESQPIYDKFMEE